MRELRLGESRHAQLDEWITELRAALEAMCWQFAYRTVKDGKRCLSDGGLSALEEAFAVLEWDDPHDVGEAGACAAAGCPEWATTGLPYLDRYVWLCPRHYGDLRDGPGITLR